MWYQKRGTDMHVLGGKKRLYISHSGSRETDCNWMALQPIWNSHTYKVQHSRKSYCYVCIYSNQRVCVPACMCILTHYKLTFFFFFFTPSLLCTVTLILQFTKYWIDGLLLGQSLLSLNNDFINNTAYTWKKL